MKNSREYIFSYQNMLTTDVPINRHYLLVRCVPSQNDFQQLKELDFASYGFDVLNDGIDSFGNAICYGGKLHEHKSLMWQSSGVVEQTPYQEKNRSDPFIYSLMSSLTCMTSDMKDELFSADIPKNEFKRAEFLTQKVYSYMEYIPSVTDNQTTAAQAFHLKKGVCQDYANLLMSYARALDMPVRYVNGLICGDGKTHAWVEFLINDTWYGFDPTHNRKIEYGYIKLAHGRDANDCPVCRGVFMGDALQTMSVHVCVGEL
ncbi:MAG: transglutaminase family protein [Succinivibrio sp.]